jgi:hypothetical protein
LACNHLPEKQLFWLVVTNLMFWPTEMMIWNDVCFSKALKPPTRFTRFTFFVQTKRDDWGINNGCVRQVGVPLRHWRGS